MPESDRPPTYDQATNGQTNSNSVEENASDNVEISTGEYYALMLMNSIMNIINDDKSSDKDKNNQIQRMNELIQIKRDNNYKSLNSISLDKMIEMRNLLEDKYKIRKFVTYQEHLDDVRAAYPHLSYMVARKKASVTYIPIKEEKLIFEFHAHYVERVRDRRRTYIKTIEETIASLKELSAELSPDNKPELNVLKWRDHLKKVSEENPSLSKEDINRKARESYKPFKMFTEAKNLLKELNSKKQSIFKSQKNVLDLLIKFLDNKLKSLQQAQSQAQAQTEDKSKSEEKN